MPGLICAFLLAATPHVVEVRSLPRSIRPEAQMETEEMPIPEDLPVPPEFIRREGEPMIAQPIEVAPSAAQTLQTFVALDDDNSSFPPDTNGAAGLSHLVTILNTQMRIQTRGGAVLQTISTRTFFNAVRNNGRVFDPHVIYDPRANRWMIAAVSDQKIISTGSRTGSALLVGVSRNSNPLDLWDLYRYDSATDIWYDFPQIGFDDETITISLNTYALSDDHFVRSTLYVINRAAPADVFNRIDYAGNGGTLTPTISMDIGNRTFLVQRWNANFQGAGYIRLYAISSAGVTPITFISTPTPWTNSGAGDTDFAPQLGKTQKIDSGDDRMQSAILRNGVIWSVQAAFYPATTPSRAAINWWRLTTTGTVLSRGTIEDPTAAFHYAYPSLAVNRRNEGLIGCSRFTATGYASAAYVIVSSDTPTIYKQGEAPYFKIGTGLRNRWGDYSATSIDPVNDLDFWTVQEYAATPSTNFDKWGTWWAQVTTTVPATTKRRSTRH
jgi:hypothetical protein